MPLAATICSDDIYESFNSSEPIKTFWHGHSYTGNPLGCAAGIASWKLLNENEQVFKNMEQIHLKNFEHLKDHSGLKNLRVKGTIAAMDISGSGETGWEEGYLNPISKKLRVEALDKGYLLRPLGNVLYLMPPYCVTEEELDGIYDAILDLVSI